MKMETLNGKILDNFQLQNSLIRIVDIVNFEGPLVSLFQNINNQHLYLFDWVDKDNSFNRWLIYRCNPKILHKFIREEISHYDLFFSDESSCFVVDIDKHLKWHNITQIEKIELSTSYLPIKDDFFEKCDCPDPEKLEVFLNQSVESQKQENLMVIPSVYLQKEELVTKSVFFSKYYVTTNNKTPSNHISSKPVYKLTEYTPINPNTQLQPNYSKKFNFNNVRANY